MPAVDSSVLRGRRMTGRAVIVSTGGTYALSSDEALNGIIDVQGALTSDLTVTFPAVDGHAWFVQNNTTGAQSVTCSVASGVVVTQGKSAALMSDGSAMKLLANDAVAAGYVVVGPSASAQNTIQPTVASVTPITLKGAAAQTAPLLSAQNSAGTVQSVITPAGAFGGLDGSGTDASGGDVTVAAGFSTGLGSSGQLHFKMSAPGAGSGSSLNASFDKLALNRVRSVMLMEPGSTDTLQLQSRLAADGTNTTQRIAGIAFRGFHWTGAASANDDVLMDLNYTDTTHYQWRVVTSGQPRLWVDSAGNVTVGSSAQTGALFNVAGNAVITGALISLGDPTDISIGSGTGTKLGLNSASKLAFWGATPVIRQTVTGSRGANAALASLLTALAAAGIVTDSSSA